MSRTFGDGLRGTLWKEFPVDDRGKGQQDTASCDPFSPHCRIRGCLKLLGELFLDV